MYMATSAFRMSSSPLFGAPTSPGRAGRVAHDTDQCNAAILQQDAELVPPEPGRRICGAQAPRQPLGDFLEHLIPKGVAERVVDGIEVVEVEE